MRLVIHLDLQGLVKVEIEAAPETQSEAHRFWNLLRSDVEALDAAVRRLGSREEGKGEEMGHASR